MNQVNSIELHAFRATLTRFLLFLRCLGGRRSLPNVGLVLGRLAHQQLQHRGQVLVDVSTQIPCPTASWLDCVYEIDTTMCSSVVIERSSPLSHRREVKPRHAGLLLFPIMSQGDNSEYRAISHIFARNKDDGFQGRKTSWSQSRWLVHNCTPD